MDSNEVAQPVLKAAIAWLGAGLTLDKLVSICTLIYTLLLIGEWAWKKAKK